MVAIGGIQNKKTREMTLAEFEKARTDRSGKSIFRYESQTETLAHCIFTLRDMAALTQCIHGFRRLNPWSNSGGGGPFPPPNTPDIQNSLDCYGLVTFTAGHTVSNLLL